MLDFSAIMEEVEEASPYPELFQSYIRQQAEEQMKMQEQMVREELLRTYLISPGGPGIVKAILGQLGSETGERLFAEIQEEAKKYIVEEDDSGYTNTHGSSSIRSSDDGFVRRSNGE